MANRLELMAEALAIAIYCALKESDFKKALLMSVNHDGDSDSTGSICGNLMGVVLGMDGIPEEWTWNSRIITVPLIILKTTY